MFQRLPIIVTLLLICCSTRAWSDEFDAAQLVGNWKYVSGVRAGQEVLPERLVGTVKITADSFTVPSGEEQPFVMAYTLHAKTNPVGIDLKITEGPVPEGKALGIIKMEDGKLAFCYDPMGEKRPTAFSSTEENGVFLFWLEPMVSE